MIIRFFKITKLPQVITASIVSLTIMLVLKNGHTSFNDFISLTALISAFLLSLFIISKNSILKNNQFTTLGLILFSGAYFRMPTDINIDISYIFLLLSIRRIYSLKSNTNISKKLFDVGFWLAISCFFNPYNIFFLITVVLGIYFFYKINLKIILKSICGFLVATLLLLFYTSYTSLQTLNGDFIINYLDLSIIDELPPGRKDVITVSRKDKNRLKVFGFIKDQIKKGRQIYVVYPLIEESKKMDLKFLEDGYESIIKEFDIDNYTVGIMHGRMKSSNKDFEMNNFLKGKTNILVSTTVIEVGVNVPNASVMIIENAERFGLSQLHQLRGRVGRGSYDSYCILMTKDKISDDAKVRIDAMVESNDGFKISEVDLKLRGPGNILGTQQSGILDFKIANLLEDGDILKNASNEATILIKNDSKLIQNKNYNIRKFILNNPFNKSWNEIG